MNKLKVTLTGLFALCLSAGVLNAQNATGTPAAKQAPAKKTAATPAKAKTGSTKAATSSTTTAKPAQHLKKDGTPDMRYKENKAAAGKTTTKKAAPAKAAPAKSAASSTSSGK